MAEAVGSQTLLNSYFEPEGERLDALLVSLLRQKQTDKAVTLILASPLLFS